MLGFEIPKQLEIEVGNPHTVDEKGQIHFSHEVDIYTSLFRSTSQLETALKLTHEAADSVRINVISAACSIGAEADSLLAYQNASGHEAKIALKGIDINRSTIRCARFGRYLLPRAITYGYEYEPIATDLDRMGFEYDFDRVLQEPGRHNDSGYYLIKSQGVRQPHEVSFAQGDLTQTEALEDHEPADLILANNIFYHLKPDQADAMLRNLAGNLTDGGVLSIGDILTRQGFRREMGPKRPWSDVFFGNWIVHATNILEDEFGMQVAEVGRFGQPTIFRRA